MKLETISVTHEHATIKLLYAKITFSNSKHNNLVTAKKEKQTLSLLKKS